MKRLTQSEYAEPEHARQPLEEALVIHQCSEATKNHKLVIFVHGLGGSRYEAGATWGSFPRYIFEDLPDIDVGMYQYLPMLSTVAGYGDKLFEYKG